MKPTIEDLRSIQANEMTVLSEAQVKAIRAALDVAEGAAEYDCCDDKNCVINIFRATIAPSKPEGT
jgi:hypothetical protein